MSWLSSAIDKGRKALGLPVISTANIGKLVGAVGVDVAGFVPGGNALVNGVENFLGANQGQSVSQIASTTASNISNGMKTQATANQAVYDLTHSSTVTIVLVIVVVFLLFGKKG